MSIDKLLDYIGWAFLVATILLLKFSERLLENMVKANSFLLEYGLYGATLSSILLFVLYKTNPGYYEGGEQRASAVLGYFFGVVAVFVFCSAYYNLETGKQNTKDLKAVVTDKSKNIRYQTTYLTLRLENRTERFNPVDAEWEKIQENDTIVVTVAQGQLGYSHILIFSNLSKQATDSQKGRQRH